MKIKSGMPFGTVYVLADKLCTEAFKNANIDALIEYCKEQPAPLEELTPVVSHNLSDSPLVTAFMEQIAFDIADGRGGLYEFDEEKLRHFGNVLGDTKAMRRFIS